jgi:enoyl-CoA hydratase/carnithine racemase
MTIFLPGNMSLPIVSYQAGLHLNLLVGGLFIQQKCLGYQQWLQRNWPVDTPDTGTQRSTSMITIDTGTDELLCHIDDRVAVITLNKPHKKNALGDILTPALRNTLLLVEQDDRVGCVMITGSGDAFCSGGDVSGMGASPGQPRSTQERIAELTLKQETLTLRLYELDKITVAALPGAAAGAGLSIALACDLRVAAKRAFVTTAFRNIGLSGDYGGSWFLPRLIGLARAKELYYTAQRVSSEQAVQLGLVNRVFDDETFREDAQAYASEIANGPSGALRRMKVNLNQGLDQGLRESLVLEARHLIESGNSNEAQEAITAFMEKRPPIFHTDL